jgi:hypothetical protein
MTGEKKRLRKQSLTSLTAEDTSGKMVQVYFDNNFFSRRFAGLDIVALATQCISRDLQWCFSEELLFELFDAVKADNNKTRELMARWANFCLELSPQSKIFRNSARIVIDELERKSAVLFESDPNATERIRGFFSSLSEANLLPKIQIVWAASEQVRASDEKFRLDLEGFRKKRAKKLAFNDFAFIFLRRHFDTLECGEPEKTAQEILSGLCSYPHLRTFLLAAHKLSYERTGKGHRADLRHLVYATSVDLFVTDDDPTTTLAKEIFGSKPRVITQQQFLSEIGVQENEFLYTVSSELSTRA